MFIVACCFTIINSFLIKLIFRGMKINYSRISIMLATLVVGILLRGVNSSTKSPSWDQNTDYLKVGKQWFNQEHQQ
jgi:hypothetical protein